MKRSSSRCADRILGRVTLEDVYDPITDELIIARRRRDRVKRQPTRSRRPASKRFRIRSVLTCESKYGVCAKCYGRNLATMEMVEIGEAVGVIAAQSIGEPGTQLTLRTFHIGGTAARIAEQSQVESKYNGIVKSRGITVVEREDGTLWSSSREGIGEVHIIDEKERVRTRLKVPYGAHLLDHGRPGRSKDGDIIFEWDPYTGRRAAEKAGEVEFKDIITDRLRPRGDRRTDRSASS